MEVLIAPQKSGERAGWSKGELAFLVFLLLVLAAVSGLGLHAYDEAMKNEHTKRNGELWAAWLTGESAKRAQPGYEHRLCASQGARRPNDPSDAAAPVLSPVFADSSATWGPCLTHLSLHTELKAIRNPFTGKPPVFVAVCDPRDRSLPGAVAIEKVLPLAPGSAIAASASPFVASDSIAQTVHLKISVCDKGASAINIAEIDF